ncbi:MAG: hypothetical protein ACJA13_003706 [Paraglaciecola sp.]|jgi:hypothetical protein
MDGNLVVNQSLFFYLDKPDRVNTYHSRILASSIGIHFVTMVILLTLYWLFSSFFYLLLAAEPLN